ncbi:hypothetical protein ACFSF3_22330 [Vibrio chagasii]
MPLEQQQSHYDDASHYGWCARNLTAVGRINLPNGQAYPLPI